MNVTATQYAALLKVSVPSVTNRINNSVNLPGVAVIERFGNAWKLTLSDNFNATTAREEFLKYKKPTA